ncbi:MAG TPA: SRPBCC family protein [Actinocrinis sp.]|nr:SRPBCC family protein [Actinocrinis sp.]
MWEHEYSIEVDLTPQAVWKVWSDVAGAATWNEGIESIEMYGPFAAGTEFLMTPPGRNPVLMRLAEVVDNEMFVEETQAHGLLIRIVHRVEPLGEHRCTVTYRTHITGPGADQAGAHIGPGITAPFPRAVAQLVERAQQTAP